MPNLIKIKMKRIKETIHTVMFMVGLAMGSVVLLAPLPAHAEMLMDYIGFRSNNLHSLPRWVRVLDKLDYEKELFKECDANIRECASPSLVSWREFMKGQHGRSRAEQVRAVNKFVNKWPYLTDSKAWGRSDYWATPLEFMQHSGDCEDYAILKYTSLRELGVPAEDLRITVVQDTVRNIAHAVLAVRVEGEMMILDSLFTAVLEEDKLLQYKPYYAVNENTRWTYIPPLNRFGRRLR